MVYIIRLSLVTYLQHSFFYIRFMIYYKTAHVPSQDHYFPLYCARGPRIHVPSGYNLNSESIISLPWEEKNIKFSWKNPLELKVHQNPPKWKSQGRNVLHSRERYFNIYNIIGYNITSISSYNTFVIGYLIIGFVFLYTFHNSL